MEVNPTLPMKTPIAVLLERKKIPVRSVSSTLTVAEAVAVMNDQKISSVLIMDSDKLIGIFTERDVLQRVIGARLDPHTTPLREVMSVDVATITAAATLDETMALFAEKHCRHLPAMDGDKVVGMISAGDISRWLGEVYRAEADHLKDYISGGYSG